MNLFAIVINSDMYYFIDDVSDKKRSILDKYISTYHSSFEDDSNKVFYTLLDDIVRDLNIVLKPTKLIDIYRIQDN